MVTLWCLADLDSLASFEDFDSGSFADFENNGVVISGMSVVAFVSSATVDMSAGVEMSFTESRNVTALFSVVRL